MTGIFSFLSYLSGCILCLHISCWVWLKVTRMRLCVEFLKDYLTGISGYLSNGSARMRAIRATVRAGKLQFFWELGGVLLGGSSSCAGGTRLYIYQHDTIKPNFLFQNLSLSNCLRMGEPQYVEENPQHNMFPTLYFSMLDTILQYPEPYFMLCSQFLPRT